MRFLSENEFSIVNLQDINQSCISAERACSKKIVITFDDGYKDFYSTAFPILSKYNFSATVFLPTGFIRNNSSRFHEKDCLTWSDIRELHASGISFGSHTISHPELYALSAKDIEFQVHGSKSKIEDELGTRVDSFSYPYSFPEADQKFTSRLLHILEKCNYKYSVTTIIGTNNSIGKNHQRHFLERIPLNASDTKEDLLAKLDGAYNWLHHLQYAYKLLKFTKTNKWRQDRI